MNLDKKDIIMDAANKMIQDFDGKQKPSKKESRVYFCGLLLDTLKNMTEKELDEQIKEIYGDMNDGTVHIVFCSKLLEEKKSLWKSKNKKYHML